MNNKELLRIAKAISTTTLGTGGLLGPEDATKFIDTLVDQSRILSMVRNVPMIASPKNIDIISVASRQLRKHQEGIDPGYRAKISTTRNQLNSVKCMLPVEITEDTFEENIEKEGFEATLMSLFTKLYGNDLADLSFNGDTADTGADKDFLTINDGWIKMAKTRANVSDTAASVDYILIFKNALKKMPSRFRGNKAVLRFLVSPNDEIGYRDKIVTSRQTAMGDMYLNEDRRAMYQGILVEPIEYIPDGTFLLTNPLNLVFGIEYGIKVKRDEDIFADVRQFAITTKNDFEFEVDEAIVIAYDVSP